MTTPNEELQARHVEVLQAVRTVFKNIPAPCAERDALDYAIAALARQEEGREAMPVGKVLGSCRVKWTAGHYPPAGTNLYTHPAPPSAGEGDAATLMEGWHSAINDADEIFANTDTSKRDAIRNRASRVVNWLKAHPPVATPTPQAADNAAVAELREIMADESGEREALLVSFFRTTGAAMGRHGDAMGWTPEQTARHYLSEASK